MIGILHQDIYQISLMMYKYQPSSVHEKKFFDGIMPFNLKEVSSYSPKYISGNLSENYSVSLEDGHKEAVSKWIVS